MLACRVYSLIKILNPEDSDMYATLFFDLITKDEKPLLNLPK